MTIHHSAVFSRLAQGVPGSILLAVLACSTASAAGVTDYRSLQPTSVTMPARGGSYIDPDFGTKIIRVTDSRDGTRCTHAYSYWPAFNATGTKFLIACDDVARIYKFDPTTDKVYYDGLLTGTDGYPLQWEGATWSDTYGSTLFALDAKGTRLWKINVGTRGLAGYTLLKDFSGKFPGKILAQLTVSSSGDIFSFQTRDPSTGAHLDAVVWVRSTNTTYLFKRSSTQALDESKVGKTSKKVLISWNDGCATLWDFRYGTYKDYSNTSATADINGHFDLGADFVANSDGWNTGIAVRTWSSFGYPGNAVRYLRPDGTLNWSIADHVSLRAYDESNIYVSTYAGDRTWAAFEDEIYMVRSDGSGFVRLAHTRSKEANTNPALRYYAQPRAVVSRDGHYVMFTSDLGSTSRFDVMILKVPSAYWPM